MPNYMVLIKDSNGLDTEFFDNWDEADSFLYDIDTAAVVEIYERVYDESLATSLAQKSLDIWRGEILMAETWVERHGALIGGLIAFGVMFVLFAWGMSM